MIIPRASFHPLLSSVFCFFFNNFLNSEDNLICDCDAEVSLPTLGLVGLWMLSIPSRAQHPKASPRTPSMMGSKEDNSDLYLTLGGTKEFPFARRNTEIHGQ